MIAKFWWNSDENERFIGCRGINSARLHGDLGLKDLRVFNRAILAKQFWRLLVHHESLVGQVFHARYFLGSSILDPELGFQPSFTWRSILSSKALI
ncbi:UNVERIFIED_CONTAM: hypothetical protein Sradi_0197800 [Sesamum radiatum]|uniref:Uncharacterized protein n=1 Tax=Sesamum radiatum TaxID=300843 RepID=A0AAW2VZ07_SESRA